jgi:aspartyl-tRNA(Asn)/glutamyl-tRNA(Gln) amidotransferase subunit A
MGTDAPVVDAIAAATQVLAGRGATIVPIELPNMDAVSAYVSIVSRCEAAAIHARWMRERPQDYAIHLSSRLYAGYAIPAAYYVEALSGRGPLLKSFCAEVFAKVDVIALPTMLPTLDATNVDIGPAGTEHAFGAVSINTRPFNYLGLPAASINCGFDPNGCPIGLQIVGRPFAEARVLMVADAYQRDTTWHTMVPAGLTS